MVAQKARKGCISNKFLAEEEPHWPRDRNAYAITEHPPPKDIGCAQCAVCDGIHVRHVDGRYPGRNRILDTVMTSFIPEEALILERRCKAP